LYKFGSTLQEATDSVVSEADAKIFLDIIEDLNLRYIIASEDFLAYYQIELGLLFIGEGEGTIWHARPVYSFYPDCMNQGASQLEQIGETGDIECHTAFDLSKFLQEHELRVPSLQGNSLRVSDERTDILGRERGGEDT
jgi:hypothetical protein